MIKYTAKYFEKTAKIMESFKPDSIVTLQFFQRKDNSVLCGINEVLKLLKTNTNINKYKIKHLSEGSTIHNKDIVLELEGHYQDFGIYEGVIDGILARQTSIATNARNVIKETNKQIIFMGDRADHYRNQKSDGYAISVGGINTQVTDAQIEDHDGTAVGTIPHALIQMFDGNLILALKAYNKTFPDQNLVALVDFNNDVIGDSLAALQEFKDKLWGVRVDTSESVSDKMFEKNQEYGVTPEMVKRLRKSLDENNGKHVKIIVSSGFNAIKIKKFESLNSPVDIYGVGASLLKIENHFTADAVKINGKQIAKVGRKYRKIKL